MADVVEEAMQVIALTEGQEIHHIRSRLAGDVRGLRPGDTSGLADDGTVDGHLRDLPGNPEVPPEDGHAQMPHRGPADGRVISGVAVPPPDDASPDNLLRSLDRYGFEECARICIFIRDVCGAHLTRADYAWVSEELKACLQNHDKGRGRAYFYELRYLQMRIEYLLSLGSLLQG
ncbi:hypothetical protein [Pantoea agglomerans]|uniref:hypothetical protein n=1 Tax=Enterobacter agglomerans TaxID=549 RepID=UPI0024139FA6|nr:hypothetical protein [Pantoea agglomerans]